MVEDLLNVEVSSLSNNAEFWKSFRANFISSYTHAHTGQLGICGRGFLRLSDR